MSPYRQACSLVAASLALGLVVWLSFVPSIVLAGPPFVTDDPETPEWHGFEINNALTLEQTGHDRAIQMPLLDINYGYKPNVQLKVEFPYLYDSSEGEKQQRGLGDTLVGVKWRFYEQDAKPLRDKSTPDGTPSCTTLQDDADFIEQEVRFNRLQEV